MIWYFLNVKIEFLKIVWPYIIAKLTLYFIYSEKYVTVLIIVGGIEHKTNIINIGWVLFNYRTAYMFSIICMTHDDESKSV